jgi:hypothetical protein
MRYAMNKSMIIAGLLGATVDAVHDRGGFAEV